MTRRHNGEGSIFPYRNGFAAYAWIVTPDGRRQRKYVYGKSRQAVHDRWLRLVAAARRGPVAPSVPSLRQYLDRWLRETVRPNLAPSTVANYEFFSDAYINPSLGSKRLDRLTVRDVQLWMNDLRERCQCCAQGKDAARRRPRCCAAGKCCRQIASEWTRHQAWTILQSALSAAVREELVSRNVAALVKVSTPRARTTLVWTVDQSRQFLENARGENDPYYVAYVLMLVLGLRRGEVLGLGWDDVDLDAARQSSPGSFSESGDNSCGDPPRLLLRTQLCPSHGSVSRRWNRAATPNGSCVPRRKRGVSRILC
jgi:hypothetical protein